MNFKIVILSSVICLLVLALPPPAISAGELNCSQPSHARDCDRFVRVAAIIAQQDESGVVRKVDPRGALTKLGPKLGLSSTEIDRIRKAVGYVICEGTEFNNRADSTGVLYGSGAQVMTTAHGLVDETGRSRGPCYFQNQAVSPVRVELDLRVGKILRPALHEGTDLAFVRLKKIIPGVAGFPIDVSGTAAGQKQQLIVVSAGQIGMANIVDPREPIVQRCRTIDMLPPVADDAAIAFGDCTVPPGASGSPGFVRLSGQLTINIIITEAGLNKKDYEPYSVDRKNYSAGPLIQGAVALHALEYETGRSFERKGYNILGLTLADLTADLRSKYNIDGQPKGAVVIRIEPDGSLPAEHVLAGDRIVEVAREDVVHAEDVLRIVKRLKELGKKNATMLVYDPAGKPRYVTVPLK